MNKSILSAAWLFVLGGCVATAPVIPTHMVSAPFDAVAARAQLADGSNTIKGNSFMRQQGGGVVTCAGQAVYLIPATAYATERVRMLYGSTERGINSGQRRYQFSPDPAEYRDLLKTTRCDAQGNFLFERISDGEFYLNTAVAWQVGGVQQGGQLMQRVAVKGGQSISVVVAP